MEQPNMDYINQLSGDNIDFKEKIIAIIKIELPEEIAVYQNFMQTKNFKAAAESVHKLKHKISILGLEKNYYIAERFEDNLKLNSTDLQSDFENVLDLMSEFISKL